jgi:OOP family OmpA-OmpF porin
MNRISVGIVILVVCLIAACSGLRKPTQIEIFEQYDAINQLDKEITKAKAGLVDTYAPQGFNKAQSLLNDSILRAQKYETTDALNIATSGLEVLKKAQQDAENIKKMMWEVGEYRDKAMSANAQDLFKEDFGEAEELFRKTTALLENGKTAKAKGNQAKLIQLYSNLERQSLEKGVVEVAKIAFEQAKLAEADEYAPKYFKRAQQELNLAIGVLEADRTRTEQANKHATLSAKLARDASQISELAKMFSIRDYTHEDTILWYWQQLETINEPFGDTIDFQQPNHIAVQSVKQKITNLMESYQAATTAIKKYETELSENQVMQAEKERIDEETKRKFASVHALFTPSEARVYRKGDNVLISANGFYFPSGGDEIQSTNFGLLNKMLNATKQFPNSRIEISGHTDSVGAPEANAALSERRAQKVADFLVDVGQIPANRVIVRGYGDTKPVANNKTKEGRAQNRRIELLIINE